MQPAIRCSVVITTCDRREHLLKAINSVERQTTAPAEIIVVDDKSDYDVQALVSGCCTSGIPITVLVQPVRSGAPTARNAGAALAVGDILMFLDDDDQWAPNKIALQISTFTANPDAGWVYTGIQSLNTISNEITHYTTSHLSGNVWPDILFRNFAGSTSAVAIKRDLFLSLGGFDPAFRALQDFELWCRLAMAAPVAYDGGHGLLFSAEHPPGYRRISTVIENYRTAYSQLEAKHEHVLAQLGWTARRRYRANTRLVLLGKYLLAKRYARAAASLIAATLSYPPTIGRLLRHALARQRKTLPPRFPIEGNRGAVTISVVIPAYNRARTIGKAINSVLDQTLPVCEIIVVDDGSTDDLAGALAPYGDQISLIRHTDNQGAAAARNTGVAAAQGNYIAFLDSDDHWTPDKLCRQIAFMQTAGSDFCCTGFFVNGRPAKRPFGEGITLQDLVWGCYFSPGSTLIASRTALLALGGYDMTCRRLEDWDMLLRASLAGYQISFLETHLAHIFPSANGGGSTAMLDSLATLRQRHLATLGARAFYLKRHFRSALLFTRASVYYHQGRLLRMSVFLLASLLIGPFNNRCSKVVLFPKLGRALARLRPMDHYPSMHVKVETPGHTKVLP